MTDMKMRTEAQQKDGFRVPMCPEKSSAKEILQNVDLLRNRMCDREERLERLASELERMTGVLSLSGRGSGCTSSRLEMLECEKDELEREYLAAAGGFNEAVKRAYRLIDSLPDDRQRRILTYLYIERMSLGSVSRELDYSEAWIKKLHYKALQLLDENLKREKFPAV